MTAKLIWINDSIDELRTLFQIEAVLFGKYRIRANSDGPNDDFLSLTGIYFNARCRAHPPSAPWVIRSSRLPIVAARAVLQEGKSTHLKSP